MRRPTVFVAVIGACALALWLASGMGDTRSHDLREFDAHEVAHLETAMWRSYYEHRRVSLFIQLTELLERQYHLPFRRSWVGAWHAAHAAVVFQSGRSHLEYQRALPDLIAYYRLIRDASTTDFDVHCVASLELDWWMIHRERAQHPPDDLYRSLAKLQAVIYRLPEQQFAQHARARGDAMMLRDALAETGKPSEADWQRIGTLLDQSWTSLHRAVAH